MNDDNKEKLSEEFFEPSVNSQNSNESNHSVNDTNLEINDETVNLGQNVNRISINLSTISKPIILFIGPRSSGKTVTLIRLCQFISSHKSANFRYKVNDSFRSDQIYRNEKKIFSEVLADGSMAPDRTNSLNFLLIDIFKDGELFCHILEAPGEHYFHAEMKLNEFNGFKHYFEKILQSDKKKVAVYFFENNMFNNHERVGHVQKGYAELLSKIHIRLKKGHDNAILLLNKVDQIEAYIKPTAFKDVIFENDNYNNFINTLLNHNISKTQFLAFSSGTFQNNGERNAAGEEKQSWSTSKEEYPQKLWEAIDRAIVGSWGCKFW